MVQPTSHWPSFATVAAHLTALSALAIAHPLLQLIGRDPEFLVVHQIDGAGVVVFLVLMLLVVPALAIMTAWLIRRVTSKGYRSFVVLCVAAAAVALTLQALRGMPVIGHGIAALLSAGLIGVVAGFVYANYAVVRSFATALSASLLIVPAVFLLNPSISRLLERSTGEQSAPLVDTAVPIVVVIFDELPLASLLDGSQQIDATRYPAFARLATDGLWFRNATTVATHTRWAIPAILSGTYPAAAAVPTTGWYPNNIFTLFGGSHQMNVFEPMTRLCPSGVCAGEQVPAIARTAAIAKDMGIVFLHLVVPDPWTARLPPVDEAWGNFGNAGAAMSQRSGWLGLPDFDERRTKPLDFIRTISAPREKPGFWFMHILLPHNPYVYLPTGQAYDQPQRADPAMRGGFWVDERAVVGHVYQRHLLQVGYADHVLGLLVAKLKEIGVYDKALIAVVADHGVSFQPADRRRSLTDTNRADILSIPLIVKPPDGGSGEVDDEAVEVVDLLPTMASMLKVDLPWPVDGRAAVDNDEDHRQTRKVLSLPPGNRLMEDPSQYRVQDLPWSADLLQAAIQRKLALFEQGDPFKPTFSPHATLIGRALSELSVGETSDVTLVIEDRERFEDVDLRGAFVPVRVHGSVANRSPGESLNLAVAVNGTIRAMAGIAPDGSWSALVPPETLRDGRNEVAVLVVSPDGNLSAPPGGAR